MFTTLSRMIVHLFYLTVACVGECADATSSAHNRPHALHHDLSFSATKLGKS